MSFKGEVLQDLMVREDGTWMNLSDGNNTAMGVFVPKDVAMPAIVSHGGLPDTSETSCLLPGSSTVCASSTRVRLISTR